MNQPINLCFVFDEKFADFFKVALLSIDSNTSSELAVYVVDCGISEKKLIELEQFVSTLENVVLLKFGRPKREQVFEDFSMEERFSSAVFYRLAIPKIFPELERVIYLDCDIIANDDIIKLWNEDLAGCPFGAVEEEGNLFSQSAHRKHKEKFNIPADHKYFNSGVLLIDCKKFEQSRVYERVLEAIKNADVPFIFPEQDAMNFCLNNDEHYSLSPKYNFCPFTPLAKDVLRKEKRLALIEFTCVKPWFFNRKLVRVFARLHICSYTVKFLLLFWKYSDQVDKERYQSKDISYTLKFFYKRLFQPVEKLFTGKLFKR